MLNVANRSKQKQRKGFGPDKDFHHFSGGVLNYANNLHAVGGHGEQNSLVDLNQHIK